MHSSATVDLAMEPSRPKRSQTSPSLTPPPTAPLASPKSKLETKPALPPTSSRVPTRPLYIATLNSPLFFIPYSAIPSLSPQPPAPPPAAARVSPPLAASPQISPPELLEPRAAPPAAMSDGKDSLDLSGLGAAIPNSNGSLLRPSISTTPLLVLLGVWLLIDLRWFRCRAQRGG